MGKAQRRLLELELQVKSSQIIIIELLQEVRCLNEKLKESEQDRQALGDLNRWYASEAVRHPANADEARGHYRNHAGPAEFNRRQRFARLLSHLCLRSPLIKVECATR